ncbi:MAG: tyrosine-type recombinase/integrase [Pseudomonadales bacterium]|nr:tyrosine-type recombinase/integrase [Pseudomonadales bacterium]
MSRFSLHSSSPFLQQVLRSFKVRRLSESTQKTYIRWIRDFIAYYDCTHPKLLHNREVADFITHLAADLGVGPSSQNQALSALLHLYRHVIRKPLGDDINTIVWAKKAEKLPVVYSHSDITAFLQHLRDPFRLMVLLALCSGLRKSECCDLTIGSLDFERGVIRVCKAKGNKDRETYLPAILESPLQRAVAQARLTHQLDSERAALQARAPEQHQPTLHVPVHARDQFLFTTDRYGTCTRTGQWIRKPISRQYLGKVMNQALVKANLGGKGSFHSLRHTFASHAYHHGMNLRELQILLGHSSVETTLIYTHLLPGGRKPLISPLDDPPSDENKP